VHDRPKLQQCLCAQSVTTCVMALGERCREYPMASAGLSVVEAVQPQKVHDWPRKLNGVMITTVTR